jgi:hypothetical protein
VTPDHTDAAEWPEGVRLIEQLDELLPELERQRARRVIGRR